jgi:hypothetical protein
MEASNPTLEQGRVAMAQDALEIICITSLPFFYFSVFFFFSRERKIERVILDGCGLAPE